MLDFLLFLRMLVVIKVSGIL
jgi:hypothetical protein